MDSNDGSEYYPTPYKGQHLASLNNLIEKVYGRDVSPVRAQLHSPIEEISESTARYYKRKSVQSCIVALECIAPGQSGALFELVSSQQNTNSVDSTESDIVNKLISLYKDTTARVTRLEILSIFVQDYSKSQLKEMLPGLTKWRIDEARKHAALYGPGMPKEVPQTYRTRMDPAKVDHFIDFISQPHFLQDVAFGTRHLKLSTGKKLEIPNVIRTVTSSRLVKLYCATCKENGYDPLERSTLFSIFRLSVVYVALFRIW